MQTKHTMGLYSGALGIAVIWTALLIAMHRAGLGLVDSRPLSYLGVQPATARIFSLGLLTSSILFTLFAFQINRAYGVKNKFLKYFLIGQAGQVIAAIAPYGMRSNYRLVHTIAAFVLAFSLPFLIRALYKSQAKKRYHKVYKFLYYFELAMFITGMAIFTLTHGIAPIGEALPAIGFHVWILAVTCTTLTHNR